MEQINRMILFQEKQIRRVWLDETWFFSIIDVIAVLTDSVAPSKYWNKLKKQIESEGKSQFSTNRRKLKLEGIDGKMYPSDCANTEGIFRIIVAIPSPKAEPFKLWLAQLGKERIEEIENPALAMERARELYRAKGYPDEWIDMRLKSIDVRQQLTSEWKEREVQEGQEYSILTAEIAKATFGLTPTEHKETKGLVRENLRDHMTNLELIFTMLGEETTRQVIVKEDAIGFVENKKAAQKGGGVAGTARLEFEQRVGVPVVSTDNFKNQIKTAKKVKKLNTMVDPDL
jgi:DNA-damage-inducible protein D